MVSLQTSEPPRTQVGSPGSFLHSNFMQEASWVEVEFPNEKLFAQLVKKSGPCHLETLALLITT